MICKTCGSTLPDDAVVCDVCGVKVAKKKQPGVASQRLKMVGIGAGVGLVLVGAFAIPMLANGASPAASQQGSNVATDLVTQKELVVPVQASGLDASGSRIALHVKGLTSGGKSIEQDGYVNYEGKGLTLEQGMYEMTVIGSPISSSGVIYNLPTTSVSVEVSAEGGSSYTTGSSLTLTPVDAASVTDEQIEAARQWALNDPEHAASADQLAEAVRQRRDAAQKAAESAKKEDSKENESQSDQSSQSSSDSSASDQSSDNSNRSDDSDNSYNGGGSYNQPQYYGGNGTDSNSDSGSSDGAPSGDASQSDTPQDGGQDGQGGQQVDPAPPDASSGGGSGSGDTGGGSDQGSSSSSSSEQSSGGANSGGNNATA